ncbi:hypothetical protein ACFSFZ_04490 [Mixta tenebrionis]|uniref:Uncharacterized protein n=1 Tax=Mixta tenebrionis TaxID=2562439 RepID=A0A506V7J0_9GAMM|nr:hypothetical protein [Mixta tenebrionis]TPW41432.1 hypothetical protein FKM52_14380 [Mixta tenebrionis]
MINLKEIEDLIITWEAEAEGNVNLSGVRGSSEWKYETDEYIRKHHGDEANRLIRRLNEEYDTLGTDHDELTADSEREDVEHTRKAIEALCDRLMEYKN